MTLKNVTIGFAIVLLISLIGICFFIRAQNDNELYAASHSSIPKYQLCNWACHNNTQHCTQYHVKWLGAYLATTDKYYLGIINALQKGGQYQVTNIFLFVIILPTLMLYLGYRCWVLELRIRKIKGVDYDTY